MAGATLERVFLAESRHKNDYRAFENRSDSTQPSDVGKTGEPGDDVGKGKGFGYRVNNSSSRRIGN